VIEQPFQRRLAAIVAADVAGYTRLMEQDTDGTVAAWHASRSEVIDPTIARHSGRIIKHTGDGFLAEFSTARDAVLCAMEMQEGLGKSTLKFRMGIALGDIVDDGEDVHGEGVNIAARLESLAEPGCVWVSGMVSEAVRNRVDVAFDDMGAKTLKHIAMPVHAFRVDAGVRRPDHKTLAWADPLIHRPAVAVLPFANMSNDPEQEYLSDGLTEDLITALTQWRLFPVIARNSTFTYKNQAVDVVNTANELGAGYVVQGSVRKSGDRVRVSAQLIDGATGHHIWADRIDRAIGDIFELQDELSQRIAASIAPEVGRAEYKRSIASRQTELDAWDYLLRGRAELQTRTGDANAKARKLFNSAIELDPNYSDAYAGIAQSRVMDLLIQSTDDRDGSLTEALQAARQAVALDSASGSAHHALSTVYMLSDQQDRALAEGRLAVELNPSDAEILHALGNKSDLAGDPQGISKMSDAQRLNPKDAQNHIHLTFLSRAYVNAHEYVKAVACAHQCIERPPDYAPAYFILAIAFAHLYRLDEGRAALKECEQWHPGLVASRADWQPYVDDAANLHLREALRKLQTTHSA
jgi:adenylate cyclase